MWIVIQWYGSYDDDGIGGVFGPFATSDEAVKFAADRKFRRPEVRELDSPIPVSNKPEGESR